MNKRLAAIALVVAAVAAAAGLVASPSNSAEQPPYCGGFGCQALAPGVPAGLAGAIHARLGAGPIRLAPSTGNPQSQLGWTVALSADGTTALVGAEGVRHGWGAVYVYHVSSAGSWVSSSTPAATLTCAAGAIGRSVALSADGTTAFLGACVFHVSNEDAWVSSSTPTATLTVGSSPLTDYSVAASSDGTTLVAGPALYNPSVGGAYLFHVASEDAWVSSSTPTAILSNATEPANDQAGQAVAISGDGKTVLIGDQYHGSGAGWGVGEASVFHVASEAAWASSSAPTATLSNASGIAESYFGYSLALSGDGTTAFLWAAGDVDVFHTSDAAAWASTSTPTAILTTRATRVAVSTDGTTALVTDARRGAAYVFHASGEGAWASTSAPTATLTDSRGHRKDGLGVGLALSADGATVLVGAPFVEWQTGAADVFHVSDASSWLTSSTPAARLTNSALPKPHCIVPWLKGEDLEHAKLDIEFSDCSLGKVKHVHAKRKLRGRVISQSPIPGRHHAAGFKVNIKVGK
jgi:hypothetical protein